MTDLVLLRHGRTDWNTSRRIQGQSDSQLDELGHAQAAAVAPTLAGLAPAVLWSSDSDRTRDTASYVAAATGLAPTYDARLREYSFGPHEGLYRHELEGADPAAYRAFVSLDWDSMEGAERHAAVAARMTDALTELAGLVPADGVAMAVSHGAAIRTAIGALLGWDQRQCLTLRGMENCGYAVLRRADAAGLWRLHAYNRTVPVSTDTPARLTAPDFIRRGTAG